MKLEWMGNYRDVVEAMIGMGNAYYQAYNEKNFISEIQMSPAQLQVMEYILENEEQNENMSVIAKRLSISQSAFSKIANQLVKNGFLEKYHAENNRKNIIMKVSDYGKQCYEKYSRGPRTDVWRRIFKKLDTLEAEEVQIFIDCLNEFTHTMQGDTEKSESGEKEEIRLVRIEEERREKVV